MLVDRKGPGGMTDGSSGQNSKVQFVNLELNNSKATTPSSKMRTSFDTSKSPMTKGSKDLMQQSAKSGNPFATVNTNYSTGSETEVKPKKNLPAYMRPIGVFKDKSINTNCTPCNDKKPASARPTFNTSQTIKVKKNVYDKPKENAS